MLCLGSHIPLRDILPEPHPSRCLLLRMLSRIGAQSSLLGSPYPPTALSCHRVEILPCHIRRDLSSVRRRMRAIEGNAPVVAGRSVFAGGSSLPIADHVMYLSISSSSALSDFCLRC